VQERKKNGQNRKKERERDSTGRFRDFGEAGGPTQKVTRSKRAEEVEERETEEALDPKVDQEMMDVQDPSHEQSERGAEQLNERQEDGGKERSPKTELSKGETEVQRLKQEQTEQEGRKMVQESVEKVLKRGAPERAESQSLNEQEGEEQEREPESQELTDLLKGVRAQCTEVKESLKAVVDMRGRAAAEQMLGPKETRVPSKLETPRESASGSLKPSGEPLLNLLPGGIAKRPACCSGGSEGCAGST
jgi:hypothetical protein